MAASSAGTSPTGLPAHTPRRILRQATLIIPHTGERVKKRVILHEVDDQHHRPTTPDESSTETSPLLLRHRTSIATAKRKRGTISVWQAAKLGAADRAAQARDFVVSDVGKAVFKCSIAYLLGSLATFLPFLRDFLGRQDGKHMVATITVYFHPARSLGSMLDALICASAAFLYAALISIASMCVSAFFSDTLDLMPLGHAVVLVVFCGGGLGFIGWVKQRKGDPLVNVACSLASLAIITIITKEGAVQAGNFSFAKISQVLKMVVMGVMATLAVSVTIFPKSGKMNLRTDITLIADCLSDMLARITESFITGFEEGLEDKPFRNVNERHLNICSTLEKKLKEAKYEHYVAGTERQYVIEAKLVRCVQRITQSIGGLRSAAAMQFTVTKQTVPSFENWNHKQHTPHSTPASSFGPTRTPSLLSNSGELLATLSAIDELSDEDVASDEQTLGQWSIQSTGFRSPSEIFTLFIRHLGPSMRSLAFTLKEILDEEPFDQGEKHEVRINPSFHPSLCRATELYTNARQEALKIVYGQKDLHRDRPVEVEADWEEVAASCGHFSFSLLHVAEQVRQYLVILDALQLEIAERPAGRTWSWLKFWKSGEQQKSKGTGDLESEYLLGEAADPFNNEPNHTQSGPIADKGVSQPLTKERVFRRIWDALAVFRREDTKFAIKVGVGAALYALPSFLVSTRPYYAKWRGEWGLLSYMLVCSMTIGASNTTGYSRFLGTCLGAVCAIVAWDTSQGNAFVLAFLGWCMSLWTAYIIVGKGKGPMGRFIMLTYNLSALYAYSISTKDKNEGNDGNDDNNDELGLTPLIGEIAGHRVVAVLSGCIWGLTITRIVWPISAREKLKQGLTLLWLRMGMIWKRDPLMVLVDSREETTIALSRYDMNLQEEFELQQFLQTLENLQASAKSEFQLKEPFPDRQYGRILKSTGRILDAFHAMSVEILKGRTTSPGEAALLKATARERAQLSRRISHLFSVLASSLALSYQIPNDTLPDTDHTRDRLLSRIFTYRKNETADADSSQAAGAGDSNNNIGNNSSNNTSNNTGNNINGTTTKRSKLTTNTMTSTTTTTDADYGLLYTYALVTAELAREIRNVGDEVELLFGGGGGTK